MCYQIPGFLTKDGKPILGGTDIDRSDTNSQPRSTPKRRASQSHSRFRGPERPVRLAIHLGAKSRVCRFGWIANRRRLRTVPATVLRRQPALHKSDLPAVVCGRQYQTCPVPMETKGANMITNLRILSSLFLACPTCMVWPAMVRAEGESDAPSQPTQATPSAQEPTQYKAINPVVPDPASFTPYGWNAQVVSAISMRRRT